MLADARDDDLRRSAGLTGPAPVTLPQSHDCRSTSRASVPRRTDARALPAAAARPPARHPPPACTVARDGGHPVARLGDRAAAFQGPDEAEHFAYVQHLAETGDAPSPKEYAGAGSHSTEQLRALDTLGLRLLMGTTGARPSWSEADQAPWRTFKRNLPDGARGDGEGLNPLGKNPPLYYAYEAIAYQASPSRSLLGRLLATRAASLLLFLATVALAWVAVQRA